MKGMVFTEFLDMLDQKFGMELTEEIAQHAPTIKQGGGFTAVGTYDHSEMVSMVVALSEKTKMPIPILLEVFGEYLFARLAKGYPMLVEGNSGITELLKNLEGYIHVEVRKLYPDAELPTIFIHSEDENSITIDYHSKRAMSDFAVGLIKGAGNHYHQNLEIEKEDISAEKNGTSVRIKVACS